MGITLGQEPVRIRDRRCLDDEADAETPYLSGGWLIRPQKQ
jgi:hypothetical protein